MNDSRMRGRWQVSKRLYKKEAAHEPTGVGAVQKGERSKWTSSAKEAAGGYSNWGLLKCGSRADGGLGRTAPIYIVRLSLIWRPMLHSDPASTEILSAMSRVAQKEG